MALTITEVVRSALRNKRYLVVDIQFDNSYPTGGEAVAASDFGLSSIDDLRVPSQNAAGTRLFAWDQANSKIKVFTAVGTEATNASDQSTQTVRVHVIGN